MYSNLRPCYSSNNSRPVSPIPSAVAAEIAAAGPLVTNAINQFLASTDLTEQPAAQANRQSAVVLEVNQNIEGTENNENQNAEQTTLLQNEEESFALAPIDGSVLRGLYATTQNVSLNAVE